MNTRHDDDLDRTSLTRLLSLGVKSTGGPVDELIERLEDEDGTEWFARWLESQDPPPEPARLLAGDISLQEIEGLVSRGKAALGSARSREDRIEATILYFLALASGIVHHGRVLTRTSRSELDGVLVELASALPAPWAELLERAVEPTPPDA